MASRLIGRVQTAAGEALRARVAGDDAADAARRIWATPGPRWFAPGDPIWRVHEDSSMFPAGIAALLLQSLHPLAMAGVAGHSGYRGDPWGRLQRTSRYLATTTYGTIHDAEAAIERVRTIHLRVRGRDDRGRAYRASDPHLLRWVHVAETYSFLGGHQAYGARPLTPAEADAYVAQCAVPGRLLGVDDAPEDVASLRQQLEEFRPELESTTAARQAARFLLLNPPLPWMARPGYGALALGGIGLLPRWASRMLRLPRGSVVAGSARVSGSVSAQAVRWAMAGVERAPVANHDHPMR